MRVPSRKKWKYKNLSILLCVLITLFVLDSMGVTEPLITWIGQWGYASAFATGIFFVSVFTVVPASVVLVGLAENLDPMMIACFGGAGAMLGDLIIFRFLKDGVYEEIKHLVGKAAVTRTAAVFQSRSFAFITPLVGALIIASPLPDEIGIGLMGLSNITPLQFIAISFVLNSVGILAITAVVQLAG